MDALGKSVTVPPLLIRAPMRGIYVPVEPNPPVPHAVAAKESTISISG